MARMLVIVAHPDDETFGTGSVIAHAAASGVDVTVCCATKGEAGEDTTGQTNSPDELGVVRESELRAAAKVLGASQVVLLDFADSGMEGEQPADALTAVPFEAVVRPLVDVIARVQPDVVVTFDPSSVQDHRDHVRIGEAATRAFALAAADGARLYHWTLARSLMRDWQQEMRANGALEEYVDMELGRVDDEITTIVDVSAVIETRRAGMAEHRTQFSPFAGISPGLEARFLARDHFVRAVPEWTGGPLETSLFSQE